MPSVEIKDSLDVIEARNLSKWIKRETQTFKQNNALLQDIAYNVHKTTYLNIKGVPQ